MPNETVQEVQEKNSAIEKECEHLITHLEEELSQAKILNLLPGHIEKLETQIKKAKIANNATLADLQVRLLQAQEREEKENETRQAEISARGASEKAILKAQFQGAWLREGGSHEDFLAAWEKIYQAEMIKRTQENQKSNESRAQRIIKNLLRFR